MHSLGFGVKPLWCTVLALLAFASQVLAQSSSEESIKDAVTESIHFLLWVEEHSASQGSGVWGQEDQSLYTTAIVASALREAEQSHYLSDNAEVRSKINAALHRAYLHFGNQSPAAVESQALVASVRANARRGLGAHRERILNQQQVDGGWGITIEHRSSIRDTTIIADALLTDGLMELPLDRLAAVVAFLDGELIALPDVPGKAWVHGIGGDSGIMATARGVNAIRAVGQQLGSEAAIFDPVEASLEYLMHHVDPGTVSWPPSNSGDPMPMDTGTLAMVLRAYAGLRQPGELQAMLEGVLDAKIDFEDPDDTSGSPEVLGVYWTDDGVSVSDRAEYTHHSLSTAAVIKALLALPRVEDADDGVPDLVITGISVAAGDGPEASITLDSFEIENLNSTHITEEFVLDDDQEVRVQFYQGDPRRNTVINGEVVGPEPIGGLVRLDLPFPSPGAVDVKDDLGVTTIPVTYSEAYQSEVLGAIIDFDSRITESDETNNAFAFVVDTAGSFGVDTGPDIAVVGQSLSVSSTNLLETPIVQLSVSLWNAGYEPNAAQQQDIPAGAAFRVWFRAAPYDEAFSKQISNGGVVEADFSDGTLIDFVDITLAADLQSFEALDEVISVDWLPSRSPSQTVTVQVQQRPTVSFNDNYDAVLGNNADQNSFSFETGRLNMSHVRSANGELVFFLEYGDHCYSALHEFAAYVRMGTGEDWTPLGFASYGAGGTVSPCVFSIPRAQAFGLTQGVYQALGEVWSLSNGDLRTFIDDAVLQFTIPELTEITAFAAGFITDNGEPVALETLGSNPDIGQLQNIEMNLYYQSNSDGEPGVTLDWELVKVQDDEYLPFDEPVGGTLTSPSESAPGVLTYNIDLSNDFGWPQLSQGLVAMSSYAIAATITPTGTSDATPIRRQYTFTILNSEGYVLEPKTLWHNGIAVDSNPIDAQDGDRIRVVIPVKSTQQNP